MDERLLKREERAVFALRGLYQRRGYLPFKMSKFEEYELYARNKDFLSSERIISFTDLNGRLMALKPDVTLSIIKRAEDRPGVKQRFCYDESVYRPGGSGSFREITQTGLECIGDLNAYDVLEVVSLARESLELVSDGAVLALNHLGLLTALLEETGAPEALRRELTACIAGKNSHDLLRLAAENGLDAERLCACAAIYGEPGEALRQLQPLCGSRKAREALDELGELFGLLEKESATARIVFDFSLVSDTQYYNGVVFRGYLPGAAESVLAGGEYDGLMRRMGHRARGIGFALYLDRLEDRERERQWDVDVLLLCDRESDAAVIRAQVKELNDKGLSVSVQNAIPEKLRCREILDRRGEAARC